MTRPPSLHENDERTSSGASASSCSTITLEVESTNHCAGLPLQCTDEGRVRNTQSNANVLLRDHPLWHRAISYDLRAETTLFQRKPPAYAGRDTTFPRAISDPDHTAIIEWLSHQTGGADFAEKKVRNAIDLVARNNAFDPVADYLAALVWDGRSRLDAWLPDYLGVPDSAFARVVGPKFLMSAVARALQPGCQVDHVLVLEGEQGIGKTSALRILGGKYHRADLPPLDSIEAKEALRGVWLAELGELVSIYKSSLEAAKNFITLDRDTYRVPYGKCSEMHLRRLVFAATTNESEYLRDQSGNRRFWPVTCSAVDLESLARDRDQLWAEAVVRFRRGEPWYLTTSAEVEHARWEQEKRRESDPWEERIAKYAAEHRDFTASEVLAGLGITLDRQTQRDKLRVSRILQPLGYRSEQVRVGDARIRVYRRQAPEPLTSRVSRVSPSDSEDAPLGCDNQAEARDTRDGEPNDGGP